MSPNRVIFFLENNLKDSFSFVKSQYHPEHPTQKALIIFRTKLDSDFYSVFRSYCLIKLESTVYVTCSFLCCSKQDWCINSQYDMWTISPIRDEMVHSTQGHMFQMSTFYVQKGYCSMSFKCHYKLFHCCYGHEVNLVSKKWLISFIRAQQVSMEWQTICLNICMFKQSRERVKEGVAMLEIQHKMHLCQNK